MDDVAQFPETLSEWEEIESPSPLTRQPLQQSLSPSPMENDNHPQIHQEEGSPLPLPTPIPLHPNSPSSSSSSSSSPTPPSLPSSSASTNFKPDEEAPRSPSDSRLVSVKEIGKQLRLRFGILSRQVLGVASKLCNYMLIAGRFWSIISVAAVLLSLLYAKLWRPWWRPRVLRRRHNNERLLLLLRERDEKIGQLMVQIAQMNEALLARRRVPVIRVG